jgi:hypothetical protein
MVSSEQRLDAAVCSRRGELCGQVSDNGDSNLALGAIRRRGWITVIFGVVGSGRGALLQPRQVTLFATTADVRAK